MIIAGLHVPVIPFVDVAGNIAAIDPLQIAAKAVNVGGIFGFIVCVIVCVVAHTPTVGVNVYVPETVLSIVAGLHVPVIAFVDVVGKVEAGDPLQIAASAVKVGVTFGVIV